MANCFRQRAALPLLADSAMMESHLWVISYRSAHAGRAPRCPTALRSANSQNNKQINLAFLSNGLGGTTTVERWAWRHNEW